MTFDEHVAEILTLLRREKRLSYRGLKQRLDLDDDLLESIKDEIIFAKNLAVDEDDKVLVWTGGSATTVPEDQAPMPLSYPPKSLAERIPASRSALESERKHVTVLFADTKDSTELIRDLDPEVAQQLLDSTVHRMIESVHLYEGTVNQVSGDGIMAIFGAPQAHEDHAVRACHAALAIQAAMRGYAEEVRKAHSIEMRFRVGLNSGEVVVRAISNDLHTEDYSAIGLTTNLAARMENLATPDGIWMTSATLRQVEGLVRVEAVGPVVVKGIPEPMDVFELVGLTGLRGRLQATAARGLTPFVGRQAELDVLRRAQDMAGAGRGQMVAAVGEAGVGKSRLVYEFADSLTKQGWLVLESASASYRKATPYYPVLDLLRRYIHLEADDEPRTIRDKLRERVLGFDETLRDTIPALLALLDVLPEDSPFHHLPPQQQGERIRNALKRVLLSQCQAQPLLLVFEDLHWLDTETQALLEGLLESLPTAPLLLLATYRPEYEHSWGSRTFYTQLRLDPLPPANADQLLRALLGDGPSVEPLKQLLIERTEGNPFFLEESVRTLVETGSLAGERGAYSLVRTLLTIQMPAQVQAILAARIDRLPPEEKRLLQYAAVIGKQVPLALLKAIAHMPEDALRQGLAHLQSTEFLHETRLFPDVAYAFRHDLTHEVAYNGMLERHRRAYHADAGFSLERLFEGSIDGVLELLAHHFGNSAEDEKAVDYTILAADKMQRRWANSEALVYFEAALERLKAMPDDESNRLRRIDAVLKQAEVKFALGEHAEHIDALERIGAAVKSDADPRRRATWYYWMGFLHSFTGSRPEVAIGYCREASAIAETGGFDELQAFAESCLTQVKTLAGDLQGAVSSGERALATFEARGNIWWACRTLWHLSGTANNLGDWGQSLEWCERALEHGQAVDDLRLKVVGLWRKGATYIQQGDPAEGLRLCEEALKLSPTPFDRAWIKAARGHGLVKIGELDEGAGELEDVVEWFDQKNMAYARSVFALFLGEVYLRQDKRSEARDIFEEVLAASHQDGHRYLEGGATRLLGELLTVEDPTGAATHLETGAQILEEAGARNEYAKTLVAMGDLRRRDGDRAGARQLLERALGIFEDLDTIDEPPRVEAALAALEDGIPA